MYLYLFMYYVPLPIYVQCTFYQFMYNVPLPITTNIYSIHNKYIQYTQQIYTVYTTNIYSVHNKYKQSSISTIMSTMSTMVINCFTKFY